MACNRPPVRARYPPLTLGGSLVEGKCRLCKKQSQLCESHIIPEFIYKQLLRDHNKGGRFLKMNAFGKIWHDNHAVKKELLCHGCEETLSKIESPASKFYRSQSHYYGKWMLPFAVSLSWRSLIYKMEFADKPPIQDIEISDIWGGYLLSQKLQKNMLPLSQHVFLCEGIEKGFVDAGGDIISFEGERYVVTKAGSLLVIGMMKNNDRSWRKSRVKSVGGAIPIFKIGGKSQNVSLSFLKLLQAKDLFLKVAIYNSEIV